MVLPTAVLVLAAASTSVLRTGTTAAAACPAASDTDGGCGFTRAVQPDGSRSC